MKKHYILGVTLLTAVGFLAFQKSGVDSVENYLPVNGHTKFAAGSPDGKTGAPGESNCTDCHAGTVTNNSSANTLLMLDGATQQTSYTPGSSYNMSLSLNSGDVMEGFQATVLDATDAMAGSFPGTGGFGTAITSSSGRDYANHTTSSNTEGNLLWSWVWDAPATDVGIVTFYVATNIADGNGATSGDVIHLSEHLFGVSTNGIDEESVDNSNFTAGYAVNENAVVVNFNSIGVDHMLFNLIDLTGKSVFQSNLGTSEIGENTSSVNLPSDLKSGIYVVNMVVGNKAMTAKVLVQK